MTAHVLAFPVARKPRRETKADIAARVVPVALGVLAKGHGYASPDHAEIVSEVGGFTVRAWGSARGTLVLLLIYDDKGKELLRGYIPAEPENGPNVTLEGWFRISRIDFAGRADWVPKFNALPVEEGGPVGLADYMATITRVAAAMV
jgi:hypothetical protein